MSADLVRPDMPPPSAGIDQPPEALPVEPAAGEGPIEPSAEPSTESSAAVSRTEREQAAARVRAAEGLPPALRESLAALVAEKGEIAADGAARLRVEDALAVVERSLPSFWQGAGPRGARAEHPVGEGFFHGDAAELSDAEADAVARQQLARCGLLRGQRVRVGD